MILDKTMTEFVKEHKFKMESDNQNHVVFSTSGNLTKIFNYSNFLSMTLEKWMFIPSVFIDGKWIILEDPNLNNYKSSPFCETGLCKAYYDEVEQFQQAKANVIFEGFQIYFQDEESIIFINTKGELIEFRTNGEVICFDEYLITSIEDFLFYAKKEKSILTLTPEAVKKYEL